MVENLSAAGQSSPPFETRARELAILNAIAAALNASVDLDSSLRAALSSVAELLGLRTGWVFLLDEETGEERLVAAQELPPGLAAEPARMMGSCYCLDTYRAGDLDGAANVRLVRCSRLAGLLGEDRAADRGNCPLSPRKAALTSGLRYHASIPLYARGRRLGIMNVASPDWRELSPEDLRLLYTVGDLLSIAIERARLYAKSAELGAVEERNRIAREIHDTLAQGLAGIALQLETADALLEAGAEPERVGPSVRRALEQARASLEEARRSVLELRASPLEGKTLAEALAALVAGWREQNGIDATFDEVGDSTQLPARVELALYGIAREALANVARHASAERVRVVLTSEAGVARVVIDDDGRGFDPARVAEGRFGLVGMSERAKLLGGRLRVESEPGAGTRIEAETPA
jgi:two-component system NarL family sensor kinase